MRKARMKMTTVVKKPIEPDERSETPEEQSEPLVRRDTVGLRNALFDEMDALRSGRSTYQKANAIAKLGNTIIESVRMEIEVRRFLQTAPIPPLAFEPLTAMGVPIALGEAEEE